MTAAAVAATGTHRLSIAHAGAWALADQAVVSATNFVTMLFLVRSVTAHAFGAFALAYTGLLFLNSLQNALVTQPHNVLAASRHGDAYSRYTSAAAFVQGCFALASGAVVLAIAGVAAITGHVILVQLLLALAAAAVAWQLQEFVRRVLYTRGDVRSAFANDLVAYGAQACAIAVLWHGTLLNATTALWTLAAASALAAAWGFVRIRGELTTTDLDITGVIRENWTFGRWLAGGTLAGWLSLYIYPVLTALLVGVAATGVVRALQILLGPTNVIMNAFESVALPRAAAVREIRGTLGMRTFVVRAAVATAVPLVLYSVLLGALGRPILQALYPADYAQHAALLWLFGVVCLLLFAAQVLSISLRASKRTLPVFHAQTAAAVVTFTAGLALIRLDGLEGILLGMIATAATAVGALAWAMWKR